MSVKEKMIYDKKRLHGINIDYSIVKDDNDSVPAANNKFSGISK